MGLIVKYLVVGRKVPVRSDFSHSELCKNIVSKNGNKISLDVALCPLTFHDKARQMKNRVKYHRRRLKYHKSGRTFDAQVIGETYCLGSVPVVAMRLLAGDIIYLQQSIMAN